MKHMGSATRNIICTALGPGQQGWEMWACKQSHLFNCPSPCAALGHTLGFCWSRASFAGRPPAPRRLLFIPNRSIRSIYCIFFSSFLIILLLMFGRLRRWLCCRRARSCIFFLGGLLGLPSLGCHIWKSNIQIWSQTNISHQSSWDAPASLWTHKI